MGFSLKIFKMSPDLFVLQSTERAAAHTDHYVDVFVRNNAVRIKTL